MTHEGQGTEPETTPPPPVSTRWPGSTETGDEAPDNLVPPFVRGRGRTVPVVETGDAVTDSVELAGLDAVVEVGVEDVVTPADEGGGPSFGNATEEGTEAMEVAAWAPEAVEDGGGEAAGGEPAAKDGPAIGLDGEVADRLEALAARIRADGYSAAEREMDSPDRLSSLLAGVVAGYLARFRK
jgi:hypothetical protein